MKEIEEQPLTLKTGIEYLDNVNNDINIYNFPKLKKFKSITLIGCGTHTQPDG